MSQQAILWTLPAMVLLVAVVTFRMFFERKRQVAAEGIRVREIPSSSQMAARFADTRAADNYRNLFEMPVFFYAAVLTAYLVGAVAPLTVAMAWGYVALRCVHSWIHCGYNRVGHRLNVFFASNLVLWALWGAIAVVLLRQ
ncbi:MAG: MAPEG family protein [Luteimonas sp.]